MNANTAVSGNPSLGAARVLGKKGECVLEVRSGDLTDFPCDAIVCPANVFLEMRGGVSAVIRTRGSQRSAASSDQIERDAVLLGPIRIGDAVITRGYDLPCSFVIHAPTVEMPVDRATPRTVALAMAAVLRVAGRHRIRTLGCPSLGTGTGGISYAQAAGAMLGEVSRHLASKDSFLQRITFVAWEDDFSKALLNVPFPPPPSAPTASFPASRTYSADWLD